MPRLLLLSVLMPILCLGIGACSQLSVRSEQNLSNQSKIDHEVSWLKSLQLPSGAILLSTDRSAINPYFSNLAMWALLKADPKSSDVARKWIDWYINHLNMPGFSGVPGSIYDFMVKDGREMNLGTCDSFDSYGGTFLSLVSRYYSVTHDRPFLDSRLDSILLVLEAMQKTIGEHGLALSRPDSRVAYLMDNVEVWRGLKDISLTLQELGKIKEAFEAENLAKDLEKAIEVRLWSTSLGVYLPFDGSPAPDRNVFYPDGTALVWPIVFELPQAAMRKAKLWADFKSVWERRWKNASVDFFSWSLLAYTAMQAGDESLANEWERNLLANHHRNWPWHVGEAAGYLLYLHERVTADAQKEQKKSP